MQGTSKKARELSRRAIEIAEAASCLESAAMYANIAALRESLFGNAVEARRLIITDASSSARDVRAAAAMALAFDGDYVRSAKMTDDLEKDFPDDSLVKRNFLPTIRAELALTGGDADNAIELLRSATPYELGQTTSSTYGWNAMYPVYVRGEAFLKAKRASEAAGEFQKILDHRGVVINGPLVPMARLSLARAYVMQGDIAKGLAAYDDFLSLWKNADPDIPVLKQARAEYAKLKQRVT